TASLSLTQQANPPLTVVADGSSSRADRAPIDQFQFDFGDNTPLVTVKAPATSATHSYASPGTYTVRLKVVDLHGNSSNTARPTTVTGPPPEAPPVARLTVHPLGTDDLDVVADASGTTDPGNTPVANYQFDFGDSSPVVVTQAPTSSASHTYAVAGTYTVTLIA